MSKPGQQTPSFFRSEQMCLYTIVLHPESAFDCIVELGYMGGTHLVNIYDGNVVANQRFAQELERCSDLLRIIGLLQQEIDDMKLQTFYYPNVDRDEIPREKDLQSIEEALKALERELVEVSRHCEALRLRKLQLIEHRVVILKSQDFLTGARNTEVQITAYDSLMLDLLRDAGKRHDSKRDPTGPLRFITGTIPVQRFGAFELMIWRISRGNAYVKHAQFEFPDDFELKAGEHRVKVAFMIVFVGEQLEAKLQKVTQGFQVTIYACPETHKARQAVLSQINEDLKDIEGVFMRSEEHKMRILMATTPELYIWRSKMRKMHDVYYILNHLGRVRELRRMNPKYLQVDCWIPKTSLKPVRAALNRGAWRAAEHDPTQVFPPILYERAFSDKIKPPTLFRTNKFTVGFQNLIDAYGIASYRELNPAPYAIVTFPFLFAVMFGDTCHGIILTLFAWMLIHREEKIQRKQKESAKVSEIFNIIFAGRYILLLMGIFSIYTGFIYNDNFAKPINIFGSSWQVNYTTKEVKENKYLQLDPARDDNYRGVPYIVGIDPIWAGSENAIIIGNSFKMKISIIFGVFQMLFGLSLSACNALYNKSKIDFFFVFLPQTIFFLCLFFYLVVLIFLKWDTFGGHLEMPQSAGCAPSILITFINMVLLKPAEKAREGCEELMFTGQIVLERFLLFVALLSIPVLLCGKPIHFMLQRKRITRIKDPLRKDKIRRATLDGMRKSLIYSVDDLPAYRDDEEDQQLSEVWIHSGIHTIECVLGSVSHTASYLRLWALSLAHAQLADVLWKMVLQIGFKSKAGFLSSFIIFVTFAIFACLTVSILIVMEGLSAFLHTLRLHWVEFQSKFYKGTGEAFKPFLFKPSTKIDTEATEKRVH